MSSVADHHRSLLRVPHYQSHFIKGESRDVRIDDIILEGT